MSTETTDNHKIKLRLQTAITVAIILVGFGFTLGGQVSVLLGNVDRTEYVNSRSTRLVKDAKEELRIEFDYKMLKEKYEQLKKECDQ